MNLKNELGITLKSLIAIVVIFAIILGVGIFSLKKIVKRQELENLKTNMLLIEVKAKEYCENAKTKLGNNPTDESKQEVKTYLESIGSVYYENLEIDIDKFNIENKEYLYLLTDESIETMGIQDIVSNENNGYYFVKFDVEAENVEVYNSKGYTENNVTYYSLSELQQNF